MAAFCMLAAGALVLSAFPPVAATPMLSGQDTRDVEYAPHFNWSKVTVHPGEAGALNLTIVNRYNETMSDIRPSVEFKIGGNWLTASPIDPTDPSAPVFDTTTPLLPFDLVPTEERNVSFPFITKAGTPGGPYLVSLTLRFSYHNATNAVVQAVFKSMGALSGQDRLLWNVSDYQGSLNATGLDGLAPDTAILVDRGEAPALFWAAVFGGAAFFAVAYGVAEYRSLRPHSRRRKGG